MFFSVRITATIKCLDRHGVVVVERWPRMRKIGTRSPVRTSRRRGSDSSNAKRSATGVSVTGPR